MSNGKHNSNGYETQKNEQSDGKNASNDKTSSILDSFSPKLRKILDGSNDLNPAAAYRNNKTKSFQDTLNDIISEINDTENSPMDSEIASDNFGNAVAKENTAGGVNGTDGKNTNTHFDKADALKSDAVNTDEGYDNEYGSGFYFENNNNSKVKTPSDSELPLKSKPELYGELHKGRRKRVRDSVDKDPEFESFADHEVLEYILFDTIQRVDTNPYAHELIDYFGSLWGVLNANMNELLRFPYITEKTARQIRNFIPIVRRAEISRLKNNAILDTTLRAASYFRAHLLYRNNEVIYAACLDVNDRLLSICRISQGDSGTVPMDFKRVAESAFSSGASKIILAHNHPAETLSPSQDDVETTKRLCIALLSMNILLVDHIIFTSDNYYSFFVEGLMDVVYENCDRVIGSQVCRQIRKRKIGLPDKYVLENDNHKFFGEIKGEEPAIKYGKFNIDKLFSE